MEPRNIYIKSNEKINSVIASTMYSSRIFKPSMCIENPSTQRNIFISSSVLPSTLNINNSCNCKIQNNVDKSNIIIQNNNNDKYIKSNFDTNFKNTLNDRLIDKKRIELSD